MHARSKHWTHRIDWVLLLALIGLASIGVAFIYSAASVHGITDPEHWFQHRFVRQIFACVLGFGFAVGVCFVDYHLIARWSLYKIRSARQASMKRQKAFFDEIINLIRFFFTLGESK